MEGRVLIDGGLGMPSSCSVAEKRWAKGWSSECVALSLFFGRELWGVVRINTVMLECLFIIISFNVNTNRERGEVAEGGDSHGSAS